MGPLKSTYQGAVIEFSTCFQLALLMKGRVPSKQDLQRTIQGIIQSTFFLTCHAFGYSVTICTIRHLMGNFNMFTAAFIPCFISSLGAILVERPSRRSLLSLYVTNIASETVFRMLTSRGYIKPVPLGEVILFACSMGTLLYFYKSASSNDDSIYSLLSLKCAGRRANGGGKLFSVGLALEFCLKLLLNMKRIISRPAIALSILMRPSTLRLGGFLGGFSALFRASSCALRRYTGGDSKLFAFPAGILASLAFCLYKDNTIALYVFWKSLQLLYVLHSSRGYVPTVPHASVLFHCVSTAILFHAALFEPHNLRPSYWKFLQAVSGVNISTYLLASSCALRRYTGGDSKLFAFPAGILASLAFCLYKDNTIALYVFWKSLQLLYVLHSSRGYVPTVPHASVLFHCVSTAILFHAALFEPHNLRPSYWKFLQAVSGGRFAACDRKCLEIYGTNAQKSLEMVLEQHKSSNIPINSYGLH
ncbi:transmembrane protein 135-like [Diaphorina citri]|uniref:Transmembrane protein 135-like n=1 Tax=Diaphorina citri TaxID=121845 RepID=A0A1S4EN74_DIACI|nr:transmembrane protein 135-like [Diaphorina citri]